MFKSLYSFKASYATALSFKEGETFLELPGAKSDKNWYFVTAVDGRSGFVPRNYMQKLEISPSERFAHLCELLVNLNSNQSIPSAEKKETQQKLEELKKKIAAEMEMAAGEGSTADSTSGALSSLAAGDGSTMLENEFVISPLDKLKSKGSKDSLSSIRSSRKRAAPQPPSRRPAERSNSDGSEYSSLSPRASPRPPSSLDLNTTNDSLPDSIPEEKASTSNCLRLPGKGRVHKLKYSHQSSLSSVSTDSAVNDLVTVTYQHPQESCRTRALELVEIIRSSTDASHAVSIALLRSLLTNLQSSHKDLNVLVPSLINELRNDLFASESEILTSRDYTELVNILDELTKAKEDEQQRNWMLYEDEPLILRNMEKLCHTLKNANEEISRSVLSRYKYFYVQNLVEYYQMETRWSIRRILLECFVLMCSLDRPVISLLLSSVLPLEVAQDMYENAEDVERLKISAVVLTVIFSQGESLPIHYLEQQLGSKLAFFLLEKLENPPADDTEEVIADAFMALLASFNLQFEDPRSNIVLQCLGQAHSAKIFTEKLLLLFNREEDPADITGSRSGVNSIHKLILDVFSSQDCILHFYTNDLMVLIDIIARQLCDLGPGLERYTYLEMAHLVLSRSGYEEHLHRLADLQSCLQRIQQEEGESVDKTKVDEICHTFSCFKI